MRIATNIAYYTEKAIANIAQLIVIKEVGNAESSSLFTMHTLTPTLLHFM